MKRSTWILFAIAGALIAGGAIAQQAAQNSGTWIAGDVPKYVGTSIYPTLTDSGLINGTPNLVTVATLPTCSSSNKGQVYAVSDANAPTYNATVASGGAITVPVMCDGANWKSH